MLTIFKYLCLCQRHTSILHLIHTPSWLCSYIKISKMPVATFGGAVSHCFDATIWTSFLSHLWKIWQDLCLCLSASLIWRPLGKNIIIYILILFNILMVSTFSYIIKNPLLHEWTKMSILCMFMHPHHTEFTQ